MLVTLIGLAVGTTPFWKAKFVPYQLDQTHLCVLDCKRDLSLVGYSYELMVDVVPCTPIAIFRGHEARPLRPDDSRIWGFRITPRGYEAAVAEYPRFDQLHPTKWRPKVVLVRCPEVKVAPSTSKVVVGLENRDGLTPFVSEGLPTFPAQMQAELKRRNQKLYDPELSVKWIGSQAGLKIGNGNYKPVSEGSPDMRLPDSDLTVAVVKKGKSIYPLATFVESGKELTIDDIVWRSKEGWFVCRGETKSAKGLFWFYPIKK